MPGPPIQLQGSGSPPALGSLSFPQFGGGNQGIPAPNIVGAMPQAQNPLDTLQKFQSYQNQQIEMQRLQTELAARQNAIAIQNFSALQPKGLTNDDIHNAYLMSVANGVSPNVAQQYVDRLDTAMAKGPKALERELGIMSGQGMTPSDYARLVQTGIAPGGGAIMGPAGTVRLPRDMGGGGGGYTNLPTGEAEAYQSASAKAQDLENSKMDDAIQQQMIGELSRAFEHLRTNKGPYGPTSKFEQNLDIIENRLGIPDKDKVRVHNLADMEEVNKIVNMMAASGVKFGSNLALETSFGSTPSMLNSPAGREKILAQLGGMTDWRMAMRNLWMNSPEKDISSGGGMFRFNQWMNNKAPDMNWFVFDRMSPARQSEFYDDLGSPAEKRSFIANYERAQRAGLVNPMKRYVRPDERDR